MSALLAAPPRKINCVNCGLADFELIGFAADPFDTSSLLPAAACRQCGLVGLNPQYGPEAYDHFYTEVYFERLGDDYDAARDALTEDYREKLLPFLRKFLADLPREGAFLDVGAGTGTWLALVNEAHPQIDWDRIWALDPSRVACDDLGRRFPGINVECSTVEANRLPERRFDLVLCSALIEHFTDPLVALIHLNKMTKAGGRLMMFTPSLDPEAFARGPDRVFKFVHTFYFTRETLASLAQKAGFRQVSIERLPGEESRLMWFPSLVGVYEKIADVALDDIHEIRRPSPLDGVARKQVFATL